MHHFSTPQKMFGVQKGCIGNEWVNVLILDESVGIKLKLTEKVVNPSFSFSI